ncbi:palmdelphin [Providencia heimbachae]|uniref:palmdelphin n=1 Tax=Providencia heimbachae TaxID=333962 RepID=UPI00223F17B9|nr:palmdelphin [Providencia heimbachae]
MIIKDPLTHESLERDNRPILPDDGYDYSECHIDRQNAAARARTKAPHQPELKPQKPR